MNSPKQEEKDESKVLKEKLEKKEKKNGISHKIKKEHKKKKEKDSSKIQYSKVFNIYMENLLNSFKSF